MKLTTLSNTYYDVEHHGDAEQVKQALINAGATNISYELDHENEKATFTWQCPEGDEHKFDNIEWMDVEIKPKYQEPF